MQLFDRSPLLRIVECCCWGVEEKFIDRLSAVQTLLDFGADTEMKNKRGDTAFALCEFKNEKNGTNDSSMENRHSICMFR